MSSLLDMLTESLSGDATRQISQKVGADEGSVATVVSGALPLLIGALTRNSSSGGTDALAGALEKNHDGSVLDDVAGFLGQGPTADGEGILGHVLGQKKSAVEAGLGKMSGLSTDSIGSILSMLAPLVMGALGREKKSQGLDAAGLMNLLGDENQSVSQKAPDAMALLGSLLDMNNDGDVTDDITKLGGGLLGGLFGGNK